MTNYVSPPTNHSLNDMICVELENYTLEKFSTPKLNPSKKKGGGGGVEIFSIRLLAHLYYM